MLRHFGCGFFNRWRQELEVNFSRRFSCLPQSERRKSGLFGRGKRKGEQADHEVSKGIWRFKNRLMPNWTLNSKCFSYHNLIQAPEIHGHQFAHPCFLHCYTINYIHTVHGHLIMRNNDELAFIAEFADHISEFAHISIIQRSIYLIQYAERRWLYKVDGKEQSCCR